MPPIKEKQIHQMFEISVLLKGAHAVIEVVGGLFLYFISTNVITSLVTSLTQEELGQDANDVVANFLLHSAQQLSIGGKSFAAFYLLSHGVIKILLVAGLLREKMWAYPASLIVLGLFILYQVYRYTFTHSPWLIALTVFDLIVMWLVWHEYRLLRRHMPLE